MHPICAAFATTVLASPGSAAERILVLDLSSSGVDAAVAKNLSEVISAAVREVVPNATVLGQSDIANMLAAERQRDLLGCSEADSCLAELGGALGADHLVAGSVGKVGSAWLLSLKLIAARDARTVRHVSREIESEAALIEGSRQWAAHLLDPARAGGLGYLEIRGRGTVSIDGAIVGGAPLPDRAVTAGEHVVVWTADGREIARRSVSVQAYLTTVVSPAEETVTRATATATARPATLAVKTQPPGALVRARTAHERSEAGACTSNCVLELPAGDYIVEIERDDFETVDRPLALAAGSATPLDVALVGGVSRSQLEARSSQRTWAIAFSAAALAGGGVFVWQGLEARRAAKDLDGALWNEDVGATYDRGKRSAVYADVGLGVAALSSLISDYFWARLAL